MTEQRSTAYFPRTIQISAQSWSSLDLGGLSRLVAERGIPPVIFYRQLALKLNRRRPPSLPVVHAGQLNLFATLLKVYRYLIDELAEVQAPGVLADALRRGGFDPAGSETGQATERFVELFPPDDVLEGRADAAAWLKRDETAPGRRRAVLRELLLIRMAAVNPAIDSFREILDDRDLAGSSPYPRVVAGMETALAQGPLLGGLDLTLGEALRAPINASPASLSGQLGFIRDRWYGLLPQEMLEEVATAFDILLEEEREWWGGGPGPQHVPVFGGKGHGGAPGDGSSVFGGYDYPEYEQFSHDADWMSNVVMMAKMVYVWLDQLSRQHGRPITRLDQVPDAELDWLATAGFSALWLIGIWERSPASQRIKQLCGNPEAIASAYSLDDYEVAADLGGWEALANLKHRAGLRGIRLASDMVPNHTGIYSRWVMQHPDWFVQTDYPPFPTYQFNGEDLSHSGEACIQIEDGYWTKSDAAVVFRYQDRRDGRTRYIYHGNDGTSIPWNDTAQLNYLIPEVREAVIQTILHVARNFPIIRFDAAMTLAKKHYQRLWFPIRGLGGGIPSRAEHGMSREEFDALFPVEFWREVVDRVAVEVPGTLLLAEAFWLMEGYFVRTLGMHRVYNSAFMNMLKTEENAKYRQTIRNVLEFNPEVLKRFVNFMNNPDEKTAVEQFGSQGKYFGACVLLATMPGLPMFGHGQIEGYREKYGMEYKRAYWDEEVDQGLVRGHEMWIFPLLCRRWLFSGSGNFVLYDFYAGHEVDENVFAYSNRAGDHRALVLYHNRHATTAGWIRESAAFAVKGDGQEMALCRTTLGEALGCSDAERMFYAFRDQTEGLEFLRNGRELREKGLYAELGEYQFHIFLDFREIRDDEAGNWGRLCASLNGRGVESLEDELKQLQYVSLNEAFRDLLGCVPAQKLHTLAAVSENRRALARAGQRFLAVLTAQSGLAAGAAGVQLERTAEAMGCLAALFAKKGAAKGGGTPSTRFRVRAGMLLDSVTGARMLLAWLFLRKAGIEPAAYGLDCTLRRMLAGIEGTDPRSAVQLLGALLACEDAAAPGSVTPVEKVFSLAACRDFMLVHKSGGVEWFNKERFEELTSWLAAVALAEYAAERPPARDLTAWMAAAEQELQHLGDMAAHAGYRTGLFLTLLEPAKKTGGSVPAGQKAAGKEAGEPKAAGTRPPKVSKSK